MFTFAAPEKTEYENLNERTLAWSAESILNTELASILPAVVAADETSDKDFAPLICPDDTIAVDKLPDAPDPKAGVPVGMPFVSVPVVPSVHPVVTPFSKSALTTFAAPAPLEATYGVR
jgi:hypothetical protein